MDAPLTSNIWLHLGHLIREAFESSGIDPFVWHDGQVTTLATAPPVGIREVIQIAEKRTEIDPPERNTRSGERTGNLANPVI